MNLIPKPVVALIWSSLILSAVPGRGAVVTANYTSATTVPVTAASYTATGNTVDFTLNFAPPVGTNLTVVKNTGLAFIQGTFDNLPQGQSVNLAYGGITYSFVANYFGGSGNDLVLQWGNTRLLSWGSNDYGQLGINSLTSSPVPVAADQTGVLSGKTIIGLAGGSFSLTLCADGTIAAWGENSYGQLGNNSDMDAVAPGAVERGGALANKTVIAVAAGGNHALVLCSDGTLAAWGAGRYGQLGNKSWSDSRVPVAVDQSGWLAGKQVVAIAAGYSHSLALCADGTVASWGYNDQGQLGNNGTTNGNAPAAVTSSGVLSGKTVINVTAGGSHSLALCADGTLAAWGGNVAGQLGDNSKTQRNVPVAVTSSGVLSNETPVAVAAGNGFSLALCADSTVTAWGYNLHGELGNGSTTSSSVPVAVTSSGVLAGKSIVAVSAGREHSLALCTDGTVAAWGYNNTSGNLGNDSSTQSKVPVLVNTGALRAGERFVAGITGPSATHNLALVASPPLPIPTSAAATGITDTAATLNGSVNANGSDTAVTFDYGLTSAYGMNAAATPSPVTATNTMAVSATLTGLLSGTTYHYRVSGDSVGGVAKGGDLTFTTSAFATLSDLTLGSGTLEPVFAVKTVRYTATVVHVTDHLTLTPVTADPGAAITVNGATVASGAATTLDLTEGDNPILIVVTAADGIITQTYSVMVTRVPQTFRFQAAGQVGATVGSLVATGSTAGFELAFPPPTGTNLTVIRNTGTRPIGGTFDNLAQGQAVTLGLGGIIYRFVANYFGGNGNDLVLQWANTRVFGWGYNNAGPLGDKTTTDALLPVATDRTGVLANRTILALAVGGEHSAALCSDGTVAAWGNGSLGTDGPARSSVPVAVNLSGVLAGKTVVAVAAGAGHSLALCSDGTLAAWGDNSHGKLGNNSFVASNVPVAVNMTGVLAGKKVTAIAAAGEHNLVLCADGSLAAWGDDYYGQLGDNSSMSMSLVPVAVDRTGVLAGRTVVAISAGTAHSMALCTDGTVAAWGLGSDGRLGNNSTYPSFSSVPVMVDRSGVLAGRTVVAIAAGGAHSLVLCADGALVAWGLNDTGQLGINTWTRSLAPVLVDMSGVLAGKTVTAVAAEAEHSLALCADGTVAAWGNGIVGQLGNNSTPNPGSPVPVAVSTSTLAANERFMALGVGVADEFSLALVASPPPPTAATTLAASAVRDTGAMVHGSVAPNGGSTAVTFEYGLTTSYGTTVTAAPSPVTGTATSAVSRSLTGLLTGTTYHYRVRAASAGGTLPGEDMTFTTTDFATLAGLSLSQGTPAPSFDSTRTAYVATVPNAVSSLTLTPVCTHDTATVKVNGNDVVSGTASAAVPLAVGNTLLSVAVTASDGVNAAVYKVMVTRLPATFAFAAAGSVPVTAGDFAASGNAPPCVLGHVPLVGATLTVVKNTGLEPIRGTFDNLAQGQAVALRYGGITYPFVANYFGGTGNDLVLQWATTKLLGWGSNASGQLGNNATTDALVPVATDRSGVLSNRTLVTVAAGSTHTVAVCADGTLAAWGNNAVGQLGNRSTTQSLIPVAVDRSGVLSAKAGVAVAAGYDHSLALCADGTLVAWGGNSSGQLGNNGTASSSMPVAVDRSGILANKSVIAVAAGRYHSLVLCSDGSLAAWGDNSYGNLGNNSTTASPVPVAVDLGGVLAGKTVVAIAAGGSYNLALCSDGTLAAWGYNWLGQLGNSSRLDSKVPVVIETPGALAGKTVIALAAGDAHTLAWCADGTLAAWGYDNYGQLGHNGTWFSSLPTAVLRTGVLAGKTLTKVAAGASHSFALCSDGTLAAWGYNGTGQLGNNSTTSSGAPVKVTATALATGERFIALGVGATSNSTFGLVASPPPPTATTLAASGITGTGATLNGSVNAASADTAASFEYGLTNSYGATVAAVPATVSGTVATAVSKAISGLIGGATYHYRVVASNPNGTTKGADMTFTVGSNNANLAALSVSAGTLAPGFDKLTTSYIASVPFATDSVTVTPTTEHPAASVKVNGVPVANGAASGVIPLAVGNTAITTLVTAEDTITTKSYTITMTRLPENFVFNSASDVPVTANGFATGGNPATVILNYAPTPGTVLTMVNNTGLGFTLGAFSNLAQGQRVGLTFNGTTYDFAVNYYGGSGNDLVLQWAATQVVAWGGNGYGQLGDSATTRRLLPTPVDATGVLADKTIIAVAEGYLHSLALCSDGTLAAWGYNVYGQLGNNGGAPSSVPVAVEQTGVLAGRTVNAIAAGPFHNLALCTDGTLAAWGYNDEGELGDGTTATSPIPVAVNPSGALAGKQIASMSAGQYHTLALCTDGTLVSWGYNNRGQLGNDSTVSSKVPVAIGGFGALAGKTVVAVRAGGAHSLALCADGTLAAWGWNKFGQLGVPGITQSPIPVATDMGETGAGATVARIAIGGNHSLALEADGRLFAWGDNASGQLGNNSLTPSAVPVAVEMSGLAAGARCMVLASGAAAQHNLEVVGLPAGGTTPHPTRLQSLAVIGSGRDAASDLIAYAFGLDLAGEGAGSLPQGKRVGDCYVIEFTQPAGVTGITYGAEWSRTLLPGSWTEVPDSGTADEHIFSLPAGGEGKLFMRLKVTGQ